MTNVSPLYKQASLARQLLPTQTNRTLIIDQNQWKAVRGSISWRLRRSGVTQSNKGSDPRPSYRNSSSTVKRIRDRGFQTDADHSAVPAAGEAWWCLCLIDSSWARSKQTAAAVSMSRWCVVRGVRSTPSSNWTKGTFAGMFTCCLMCHTLAASFYPFGGSFIKSSCRTGRVHMFVR